jgi:hypothetical protein
MKIEWNPQLKLPTAPEAAVYQAIIDQLTRDPVLTRIFTPDNWRVFSGDATRSARPPARGGGPVVTIWPTGGPSALWSPGSQVIPLFLNIELSVPSSCVLDLVNLWHAIRTAIYSGQFESDTAFCAALQAMGAHSGVMTFSQAAFDQTPEIDGALFLSVGQVRIEIRLNT